jgi:hypothetical protein
VCTYVHICAVCVCLCICLYLCECVCVCVLSWCECECGVGSGWVGGASLHIQFPKDNMFNLLWEVSVGCKVLRGLGVNEVWHLVKMCFCA